jgi:hypothetical protein
MRVAMLRRWLLRGALVCSGVIMLTGADPLDSGELHCEEAANHLAQCCGADSAPTPACTAGRGCDSTRPSLDDPRASEIRDTPCERLIAEGECLGGHPGSDHPGPDLSMPHDLATPDLTSPDLSPLDAGGDAGDL